MNALTQLTASDDQLAHSGPVALKAERARDKIVRLIEELFATVEEQDRNGAAGVAELLTAADKIESDVSEDTTGQAAVSLAMQNLCKWSANDITERLIEERDSPNWPSREMGTYQGG